MPLHIHNLIATIAVVVLFGFFVVCILGMLLSISQGKRFKAKYFGFAALISLFGTMLCLWIMLSQSTSWMYLCLVFCLFMLLYGRRKLVEMFDAIPNEEWHQTSLKAKRSHLDKIKIISTTEKSLQTQYSKRQNRFGRRQITGVLLGYTQVITGKFLLVIAKLFLR